MQSQDAGALLIIYLSKYWLKVCILDPQNVGVWDLNGKSILTFYFP